MFRGFGCYPLLYLSARVRVLFWGFYNDDSSTFRWRHLEARLPLLDGERFAWRPVREGRAKWHGNTPSSSDVTNGGRCGSGGPLDSPLLSCPPFFNLLYLADRFVIVAGFMALNRFIVKPIFLYHKSCIFFSQKNCLILLDP